MATQLAGGQSPWLILLQQGGQVKDSFGGMIPMFRGLAGAITLPMVGATSLAVATGALAYAWYQGNSTLSDFNKTLVLSGNQAGLTADRMLVLSRAGQAAGLTFNQTSESLSALVKAGVSGEAQIASISQRVQALLIRNLVAKCSQLAFVLQRLIFMRQQGFLLCRQLATLRRLLQYRELTLRLPQIPALLADFLICSGMLLQRPEFCLKRQQGSMSTVFLTIARRHFTLDCFRLFQRSLS